MTATPRLFSPETRAEALENEAVLASMDDEAIFGPEFHRLGFGQAVGEDLLTDYKVLILTVDHDHLSSSLQSHMADENNEFNLDDAAKIVGCWNGWPSAPTKPLLHLASRRIRSRCAGRWRSPAASPSPRSRPTASPTSSVTTTGPTPTPWRASSTTWTGP